ncbi:hypothetical protein KR038_002842, partial [Drosophila bunnanda]
MSLKALKTQWRRHPRLARLLMASGVSLVTAAGFWLCDTGKMRRLLERLSYGDRKSEEESSRRQAEYIYIKYHIYRESMRQLQQKQEDDKKWISVIVNPIGKWWKAAKHSVAWRLLNIAQMGNQSERLKAVQQLICMDHLKDWDFRHLAQICDARTAVSLARSGADTRWFMPVHRRGCIKNPKLLLSELHTMLSQLRPLSCVDHFFAKYFPEQQHQHQHQHQHQQQQQQLQLQQQGSSEETPQEQTIVLSTVDMDLLREIISFLHHISKDHLVSANIIKEGGLVHLMELKKIFNEDNETLSTLCKVLANMSVVPTAVEHFFATGWIGVLAEWQQCPDLRLQVISAKVMANLDRDDPNQCIYPPNVYPLHPRIRTGRKPKADIIFVHGLMGGVFVTWRQRHRKPTELNIYGKNAFYTSQSKDLYVAAEQWRQQAAQESSTNCEATDFPSDNPETPMEDQAPANVVKASSTRHHKIGRDGTMEFVKKLRGSELDADWEVVHPDIPLNASEHCAGTFSVSGNEWLNQDTSEEYTNCWPMEWLPDDYPDARIIGIDYTSALTEWSANFTKYCPCERGQGKFEVRASTLLERIVASDVGNDRPIVWIGHSMGGLLTKLILIKSTDSEDPKVQQLAKNTRGIVFLGTPHRGSPIAKWKQHMQMILSPSIEVKEMEENAPKLLEMHRRFMDCLHKFLHRVKVVSVAEGSPTMLTSFKFPLRIVTEESSKIDFGDYYLLNDDHLGLSKPIYRQSFLYQRLLHVIEEAVKERDRDGEEEA